MRLHVSNWGGAAAGACDNSKCWAPSDGSWKFQKLTIAQSTPYAEDTNDLGEPLLGYDPDSEAHRAATGGRRHAEEGGVGGGGALVPYSINAYDWADLLRGLVTGAVTGLKGLACGNPSLYALPPNIS